MGYFRFIVDLGIDKVQCDKTCLLLGKGDTALNLDDFQSHLADVVFFTVGFLNAPGHGIVKGDSLFLSGHSQFNMVGKGNVNAVMDACL